MMPNRKNPSNMPLCHKPSFSPPPSLVRPRNGERTGDALGTEAISGYDGGGKVGNPFIPPDHQPKQCLD
jgi:hypothetical protein